MRSLHGGVLLALRLRRGEELGDDLDREHADDPPSGDRPPPRTGPRPGAGRRGRRASRRRGRAAAPAASRAGSARSRRRGRARRASRAGAARRRPAAGRALRRRARPASPAPRRSPGRRSASGASQRSMSETRISASRFSARSAPTKSSTNSVGGRHQQLGRGRVLLDPAALAHDRDPVAHLDRLVDVVGDEEDGLAELRLQAQELVLQALAVDRVDRAEGLVHQHHQRVGGERAGDADALLLAAGELRPGSGSPSSGSRPISSSSSAVRSVVRSFFQPSSCGTAAMFSATCGGGRGRSAGSRSRSPAAAAPGRARAPIRRRSGCRPRSSRPCG